MRQLSRIALILIVFLPSIAKSQVSVFAGDENKPKLNIKPPYSDENLKPKMPTTRCRQTTFHAYPDSVCYLTYDAAKPGSPQAVSVPKGTTVQIQVKNRAAFIDIQTVVTIDEGQRPDFANAFVKLFAPGLAAISVRNMQFLQSYSTEAGKSVLPTSIEDNQQAELATSLIEAKDALDNVTDELNALKKYDYSQVSAISAAYHKNQSDLLDPVAKDLCLQKVGNDLFDCARQVVIDDIYYAVAVNIPQGLFAVLDQEIKSDLPDCLKSPPKAFEQCMANVRKLQDNQADLVSANAAIKDKRTVATGVATAVASVPHLGDYIIELTEDHTRKGTVAISGKDVFKTTVQSIGSATINWQLSPRSLPFTLASGLLISPLPTRTFANGPVYVNGVPQKDASGNTKYAVTQLEVRPSFVTPLAFVNFELPFLYSKSGRVGTVVSGGLGPNLSTKEADYAAGIGLRWRSVIFEPCWHYGRETFLAGGIYVGDPSLGSTSTVPTEQHFKSHVGFAILYQLPIP